MTLPNLRPLASELVREALDAMATCDGARILAAVRRRTVGWSRREKLRLMATLAWTCAEFARRMTEDQRAAALAWLNLTDDELAQRAMKLMTDEARDG